MSVSNVLKNFALFVDGRGYLGEIDELTLPKLTLKTEEFRGGGQDAPVEIDMGMEKLEAEIKANGFNANLMALWGVQSGLPVNFTVRGALQDENGITTPVLVQLRGRVKVNDLGTWKAGEKSMLTLNVALTYYQLNHGARLIHQIDVQNMVRIIDGTDQLAATRAALGA